MAMRMQLAEVLTNREHTLMWDLRGNWASPRW